MLSKEIGWGIQPIKDNKLEGNETIVVDIATVKNATNLKLNL